MRILFLITVSGCSFSFPEPQVDPDASYDGGIDQDSHVPDPDAGMGVDADAGVLDSGDAGGDTGAGPDAEVEILDFHIDVPSPRFIMPSRFAHPFFGNLVIMSGMRFSFGSSDNVAQFNSYERSYESNDHSMSGTEYVSNFASVVISSDPTNDININLELADVRITRDPTSGMLEGFVTIDNSIGVMFGSEASEVNLCSWMAGYTTQDPCNVSDMSSWPNFPNSLCSDGVCEAGTCALGVCNAWKVAIDLN